MSAYWSRSGTFSPAESEAALYRRREAQATQAALTYPSLR